jgi:hypothetical protein
MRDELDGDALLELGIRPLGEIDSAHSAACQLADYAVRAEPLAGNEAEVMRVLGAQPFACRLAEEVAFVAEDVRDKERFDIDPEGVIIRTGGPDERDSFVSG